MLTFASEQPVVFIAGVEEGLLPLAPRHQQDLSALQEHLEEERRLFYVGITRAAATLYLSWYAVRSVHGGTDETRQQSRFLAELPANSFSVPPVCRLGAGKRKPTQRQLSLFS